MFQNCLKASKTSKCVRRLEHSIHPLSQTRPLCFDSRLCTFGRQQLFQSFAHQRGVVIKRRIATKSVLSNSGNAAHNVALAARLERETQIRQLVEKTVRLREKLIEEARIFIIINMHIWINLNTCAVVSEWRV
jgi:hypothetical protein